MAIKTRIVTFYRSCLFQIIIVGLVGLCEPGIWTALNNLGAGGQASVSYLPSRPTSVLSSGTLQSAPEQIANFSHNKLCWTHINNNFTAHIEQCG